MIKFLLAGAILLSCAAKNNNTAAMQTTAPTKDTSIYDFKVEGLTGDTIDFAKFKGKKIMIVNTASLCGNTPQYADLEKLYEQYKGKLVIVGFPANNFHEQEPGTNAEIKEFCTKNYGVSFPMAAKVSVKGDDIAPIYQYLIAKANQKGFDDPIKWNFTKFLLDENGNLITVIFHKTSVLSEEVINKL
ncbi:glutathione peroxidase [Ferruginibacter albus]|uniref:glutathione peroxidase n=1 Tax=Ferruginibacter albus TaxID=2875540 RepID=UPI001CC56E18|nr:glutathione peroxidase [Ferruginibacter albus]UAY52385.1 glutathione peroxidase [Ferruginibacter albus]